MICEICNKNLATQKHHLFSQTKYNRQLYPEYIDHPDNLVDICADCHLTKPILKWTELEFCRHFEIKPRSKELLFKIYSGKIKKFWEDEWEENVKS